MREACTSAVHHADAADAVNTGTDHSEEEAPARHRLVVTDWQSVPEAIQ